MHIKTTAQLGKIADLCRKKGIEAIKISADSIEFTLKDTPITKKRSKQAPDSGSDAESAIETSHGPSEEELLFWSTGGVPDDAPGSHG